MMTISDLEWIISIQLGTNRYNLIIIVDINILFLIK